MVYENKILCVQKYTIVETLTIRRVSVTVKYQTVLKGEKNVHVFYDFNKMKTILYRSLYLQNLVHSF